MAPFQQVRVPAVYRGPGQPSLYRPEYCEMVTEDMAAGFSLAAFAGKIGVSRETIYAWVARHPAFSDAVNRGRTGRQRAYELRLLTAEKGAQAAAAIFGLKNCAPDDWQEVRNVKHDHTHRLRQISDEQLAEMIGQSDVIDGEVIQRNDR